MIFFRKKHDETPGAREVAAAIGGGLCPHGYDPGTCAICMGMQEAPKAAPPPAATAPKPEHPLLPHLTGPEGTHAPLFVKVERYKELLATAQEIKTFIKGIKQIFAVITELEGAREEAVKLLRISVQRLEHSMKEIDAELVKPIGYEPFPHGEAEIHHLEDSLASLQRNIMGLRREVEAFRAGK